MKSTSQDQSLSDSRELDRSYDPLTGRRVVMSLLPFFVLIVFFNNLALAWLKSPLRSAPSLRR